jgi:hypothetical protein
VCESGRAYCEICWFLDRGKASTVNFAAVTTPVLAIRGECDRGVPPQVAPWTAARYQRGSYVEIPRSDHLVFFGEALPVTMGHIDDWIARNHVLAIAWLPQRMQAGVYLRRIPVPSGSWWRAWLGRRRSMVG